MTLNGAINGNGVATKWIGTAIAGLVALGSLAAVYGRFEAENAVQDERLRAIEARVLALSVDHDMLQRIDVRLANIERAITEATKAR